MQREGTATLTPLTTSHRVQAIDSVKGIAIIGVLFIHMSFTRRFDPATLADIQMLQHVFAWCVLAFFFASGYLHGNTPRTAPRWIDFVKKRARRLLVPCLLFSWGYKLALLAAKSAGMASTAPPAPPLTPLSLLVAVLSPAAPQFYFLVDLFVIAVGVHTLTRFRIFRDEMGPWILGTILLQSYWLLPLGVPHGEDPGLLPLYAASYLLGYQSSASRIPQHSRHASLRNCVLAVLGASGLAVAFARPQLLHVAVPVILLQVALRLPIRLQSPLAFLGRRSGAIYVWHTPIVMPAISLLLTHFSVNGVPLILAMTVLTLAASLAMDSLVRPFDRVGLLRL
jgi:fucose 4-O-acetylase-like acetyltransferase